MAQQLPKGFFELVEKLPSSDAKIRWYYCVIVNLAALNFPTLVPAVWEHMSSQFMSGLSHDEQFQAARKLREALIKGCGIMGAAKVRLQ
jgi:hypothetical protein